MQSPSLLRALEAGGLRSLVETDVSSERAVDGGCSDVDEFWLLGCLKIPKFLRVQTLDGAYLAGKSKRRLTMTSSRGARSRRLCSP